MKISNVHIVSDGTPMGTEVTVDGQPIVGILKVDWELRADSLATATLWIEGVDVDMLIEAEVVRCEVAGDPS